MSNIQCDCGKLIAKEKDGKIFVWCKSCKKEVEIIIEKESQYEPRKEEGRSLEGHRGI